jgi:hypothetical protein
MQDGGTADCNGKRGIAVWAYGAGGGQAVLGAGGGQAVFAQVVDLRGSSFHNSSVAER